MRILIVSENLSTPAAGAQITRDAGRILLKAGHDVAFFSLEGLPKNEGTLGGLKVYQVPRAGRFGYMYSLVHAHAVRQAVLEFKPDIAHIVVFGHVAGLSWTVMQALHDLGIPVVDAPVAYVPMCMNTYFYLNGQTCFRCLGHKYHCGLIQRCGGKMGSFTNFLYQHMAKKSLQKVAAWLSPNDVLDRALFSYGVPASRIFRTYHPFNWDKLAGLRVEQGDNFIFYAQGRKEKGIHFFPDILAQLQGYKINFYLSSVQWPYLHLLESQANTVIIRQGLTWEQGLGSALAHCRAALLPTDNQAFSDLTLYEAMALGKPVVTFRVGGNPFLIRHEIDGILAAPGNLAELIDGVKQLHDNPGLAARMGSSAQERAKKLFSHEAIYNIFSLAYQQATGKN